MKLTKSLPVIKERNCTVSLVLDRRTQRRNVTEFPLAMRFTIDRKFNFVDYQEYTEISKIVQKLPKGTALNKVKEQCPEGIKRNIIRMVMADLKRKQQNKD